MSRARHAARLQAARRLPVGVQVDAGTGQHSGGARTRGLSWRSSAAPCRPREDSGPRGADPQQPAGALAACGRRGDSRRVARRGGRHRGRLGYIVAKDTAGRRFLLDRQRPGRSDALDVWRRSTQDWRDVRARPGWKGFALQLFQQRAHGRSHCQRDNAGHADRFSRHRAAVVVGRIVHRRAWPQTWSRRRQTGERQARGVRAARHPGQQPEGQRQTHLARLATDQRPEAARLHRPARRRRARRADRYELRRPRRVSGENARGHRVRVRLAPSDRGGSAAPGRRGGSGARRTCGERHAGALARSFDGRRARTHDAARKTEGLAAIDGAPRSALVDAWHAERRVMGADAGAIRRRHLRQLAGDVRRTVPGCAARAH